MIVGVDPPAGEDQSAGGEGHLAGPLGHQQLGRAVRRLAHQHESRGRDWLGEVRHGVLLGAKAARC